MEDGLPLMNVEEMLQYELRRDSVWLKVHQRPYEQIFSDTPNALKVLRRRFSFFTGVFEEDRDGDLTLVAEVDDVDGLLSDQRKILQRIEGQVRLIRKRSDAVFRSLHEPRRLLAYYTSNGIRKGDTWYGESRETLIDIEEQISRCIAQWKTACYYSLVMSEQKRRAFLREREREVQAVMDDALQRLEGCKQTCA